MYACVSIAGSVAENFACVTAHISGGKTASLNPHS